MKNALITGINGFVGSHLAEYMISNKLADVKGTYRKNENMENISHLKKDIELIECDITDFHAMDRTINEAQPDFVFHLAAQAFVPASWRSPHETMTTNVLGSMNLFEAILKNELNPRIQIACSSEEYGLVLENEVPVKETNPLRPLSPYGVSKIAMDFSGYQYFKSYGMEIIRTRAFNHTGPRRGEVYVVSNWCKQAVEIENGKEPIILVGNLESVRDFSDVRDIVRAYWLATQKGEAGEIYNIASGSGIKMRELLEKIIALTGKKIETKTDPKRLRPSDVPVLIGDSTKFREKTGWKPEIGFDQTLQDTMNYWRKKLK